MPPIASVDIDLGQHELVEEVLGVDARACVAQYVASVYTTTPLRSRADAVLRAIEQVQGVGALSSPINDMEDVTAGTLPDLVAFVPLWVERLQRDRPSKDAWETEHERWLREAVFRGDGVDGHEQAPTGVGTRSERSWRERVTAWVCSCQPEPSVARGLIGSLLLA